MTGDISIDHGGQHVEGYLSEPEGTPRAGVVVIQEWWGLNDDIRGIADRFAAEGYLALAPDLYDGKVSTEPDEAMKLAQALERDIAAQVIDAAIGWLKAEHGVTKVGCVGFCMGGGLTLATAMRPTSNVDAVHVFYGGGMPPAEQISAITVPVMGSYGAEDQGIPADQVETLRTALESRGLPSDVRLYEGAGHSFFNAGAAFHEPSAIDAWGRTLEWFGEHLAS
jgi:carboxymethylenebutenolidase